MMHYNTLRRKAQKWYKKMFFHLVDICIYNSYVIYKSIHGETVPFLKFRMAIIRQIIEKYPPEERKRANAASEGSGRLTDRHFLAFNNPTKSKLKGQRVCHVCSQTKNKQRVRRETIYHCGTCQVALCAVPCFEVYHRCKNF